MTFTESIAPTARHTRRTALALLATAALGCAGAGQAQAIPSGPCDGPCQAPPAAASLTYQYQVQQTSYWCAAASARIALTARGVFSRQSDLARSLKITDPNVGLPSIFNLRNTLNWGTNSTYYAVKQWNSLTELRQRLRADVVYNVSHGHGVVINVNRIDSSTFAGHYVPIMGYRSNGAEYLIADPATATRRYIWRDANTVASWVKLYRYVA